MSRISRALVFIPDGISVKINGQILTLKGKNGTLNLILNRAVKVNYLDKVLSFNPRNGYVDGWAQVGTSYALLKSMIIGVTEGFTKKLHLFGIGYRATIKDDIISLSLGFSHPIQYRLPIGISAECPTQTEIILKGADKQMIGQVAADLRNYRRPEPFKGKGIRYANELVRIKEAKKK